MKKILHLLAGIVLLSAAITGCSRQEDIFEDVFDIPELPETEVLASFTFSTYGLDASFTNTSQGSSSFEWDFGDGTTSTEEFPKHTYKDNGDYTVKLTVRNSKGTAAYAENTVSIFKDPVTAFEYKQQPYRDGKFGRIVEFNAAASKNLVSIEWDFGDGSPVEQRPGTETKFSHEFTGFGTYQVKAKGTGIYGDIDEHVIEVAVNPLPELLLGGGMEAADAKYWTFKDYWTANGEYGDLEGTPAFVQDFGCTTDGPSTMKGGCLRLGGENQPHDYSYTASFYQPIDVVEGEILEISADMKWGGKSMDNGVLFLCISDNIDSFGTDGTAILQMINYWNSGTPLSEFDGNLAGIGLSSASGYNGDGSPSVRYTVPATGTIYVGFEIRSVWGTCFGPGADFYFDNLSVKIVLE